MANDQSLYPIVIFCYDRLSVLKCTVEALKLNTLAVKSELYFFSDGVKSKEDEVSVSLVRDYLKTVNGFKEVIIHERKKNYGLANNIIDGVSKILENNNSVIVLEDDLLTSDNFLSFMNSALNFYADKEVFSISGFSLPIKFNGNDDSDIYFGLRASSWGWATWKDVWDKIDWDVTDYNNFINSRKRRRSFNQGGQDLVRMLKKQMNGEINSWAVRWCYSQYKLKKYTVFPRLSKVKNIGYGNDATNTTKDPCFRINFDETKNVHFKFSKNINLQLNYVRQFKCFFGIKFKLKCRLLNLYKDVKKLLRFK